MPCDGILHQRFLAPLESSTVFLPFTFYFSLYTVFYAYVAGRCAFPTPIHFKRSVIGRSSFSFQRKFISFRPFLPPSRKNYGFPFIKKYLRPNRSCIPPFRAPLLFFCSPPGSLSLPLLLYLPVSSLLSGHSISSPHPFWERIFTFSCVMMGQFLFLASLVPPPAWILKFHPHLAPSRSLLNAPLLFYRRNFPPQQIWFFNIDSQVEPSNGSSPLPLFPIMVCKDRLPPIQSPPG